MWTYNLFIHLPASGCFQYLNFCVYINSRILDSCALLKNHVLSSTSLPWYDRGSTVCSPNSCSFLPSQEHANTLVSRCAHSSRHMTSLGQCSVSRRGKCDFPVKAARSPWFLQFLFPFSRESGGHHSLVHCWMGTGGAAVNCVEAAALASHLTYKGLHAVRSSLFCDLGLFASAA